MNRNPQAKTHSNITPRTPGSFKNMVLRHVLLFPGLYFSFVCFCLGVGDPDALYKEGICAHLNLRPWRYTVLLWFRSCGMYLNSTKAFGPTTQSQLSHNTQLLIRDAVRIARHTMYNCKFSCILRLLA